MTTQEFLSNIRHTYAQGVSLIERKNQDYANSENPFKNFDSALVVGVGVERAILLRVLDKIARISNLLDRPPIVTDEKCEDTLLDAINYLAILKAYRERSLAVPCPQKCASCGGPHDAWNCSTIELRDPFLQTK